MAILQKENNLTIRFEMECGTTDSQIPFDGELDRDRWAAFYLEGQILACIQLANERDPNITLKDFQLRADATGLVLTNLRTGEAHPISDELH